ncbi:MAG TPA: methyltransferase domain-containing protein [Myxococcota bacterium]|nr:methyltransferase domain-containing protein [Myxococcota bacterium]
MQRNASLVALTALALSACSGWKSDRTPARRDRWQHPERVVESLRIRPGDHVVDLGAGWGYFTFRLADAVGPAGRVYAVEIDEERARSLERAAREGGFSNVEVILAKPGDPLLPDGEIDLVFLCNAYHHIQDRVDYFDRLRVDLKRDGRVAIVDGRDVFAWLTLGHFPTRATRHAEMSAAHYRDAETFDFLRFQSFEVFAAGGS